MGRFIPVQRPVWCVLYTLVWVELQHSPESHSTDLAEEALNDAQRCDSICPLLEGSLSMARFDGKD